MNSLGDLKTKLKTMLGHGPLERGFFDQENCSSALKDLMTEKSEQMNTDRLKTPDYPEMEAAFNFFNNEVLKNNPDIKDISDYDSFHSGTPMRYKPFPGAVRAAKKALKSKEVYKYPRTSGDYRSHQMVLDYLKREGFEPDSLEGKNKIGIENIVFTCSTTHAYALAVEAVANKNDVILMTAPNYGLFAIMSALGNYQVEMIDLKEEDDWFVNAEALDAKITEINKRLKKKYAGEEYVPKVAAFLNINPHNPMGNVITKKNKKILEGIGDVCLKHHVFVIDDLVYRDLTYDLDNLALPMASYPKYFNNTISLFGLSKAYNLAGIRAAVILAPAPVCNLIINKIHNSMDSMPTVQVSAVAGAFNGTNRRYRAWRRYVGKLLKEYQYRYKLLRTLVYGCNKNTGWRVKRDIKRYGGKYFKDLCEGCKGLIKIKVEPRSGFFVIFDFTKLKGKTTPDGITITNENELLNYFYSRGGLRYLMGGNIFWPNKDEFVGRISFGIERKNIVSNMAIINEAIRELK